MSSGTKSMLALGIPVSTAINMFYKQIILNNGLPFKAQLPSKEPLNISEMTEEQCNEEMDKAYQSFLSVVVLNGKYS